METLIKCFDQFILELKEGGDAIESGKKFIVQFEKLLQKSYKKMSADLYKDLDIDEKVLMQCLIWSNVYRGKESPQIMNEYYIAVVMNDWPKVYFFEQYAPTLIGDEGTTKRIKSKSGERVSKQVWGEMELIKSLSNAYSESVSLVQNNNKSAKHRILKEVESWEN